ncbi:hypothetical protein C8R43DRAFT_1131072 [Mycena crocata]|nr:hypothetical protein C8R43DRAFT_1131072 [Mycena crocata]
MRVDDTTPHFKEKDPLANSKDKTQATVDTLRASAFPSSLSDSSSSSDSEPSSPQPNGSKKKGRRLCSVACRLCTPALDDGRAWLSDDFFPEERRERWIWRGRKVTVECSKHADYQEYVSWLSAPGQHVGVGAKNGEGLLSVVTLSHDPYLRSALALLRSASLTPGWIPSSPPPVFWLPTPPTTRRSGGERLWAATCESFLIRRLGRYAAETATRTHELRAFYYDNYRGHFEAVIDAAAEWFKSIAEDPLNKALVQDFARLTRHLLSDAEGNLQFERELWEDARGVILPNFVDKVGYIPIPRIEYTDDSFDLVMEKLTLSGRHVFPNIVEVEAHNLARSSPYTTTDKGDTSRHEFPFTTGIKMRDSGLADVVLGGHGLTASVTPPRQRTPAPCVGRVRAKIRKALAYAIRTGFEYVDGQLVGVCDRMTEAKESDDGSRQQVLVEIFKRKKD